MEKGVSVNGSGTISAVGSASKGIKFTGVQKSKGFWAGIEVVTNSSKNKFDYVIVEYAGNQGFDGANIKTNLMIDDNGQVSVTNSNFTNGGGSGIWLRTNTVQVPTFSENTFKDNEYSVTLPTSKYQVLDKDSDYSGNTNDYINTFRNLGIDKNVTWQALNVPYRLPGRIELVQADITIEAGAKFLCAPSSGLEVTTTGSINAVGTSSDEIVFEGEQDVRGYWAGLNFQSNNTKNNLTYVIIKNGGQTGFDGANLKANVMVEDAGRLIMANTTSSKSGGSGLYLRNDDSKIDNFSSNTITDNVFPVTALMDHYGSFDAGTSFTGNDNDYIRSVYTSSLNGNHTWDKLTVPYQLSNRTESVLGAITIEPGAVILGQPGSGIQINATGSMNAMGTTSNKIIFKGSEDVSGYWEGLRFLSNNPNNLLENFEVLNAGSEGFDGANRKAGVEVGNGGTAAFKSGKIEKSGGYGIRIQSGGSYTLSSVTFSGNTLSGDEQGGGVQNDN